MFRHVLLSIDDAPAGARALAEAIDVAERFDASLTILSAIRYPRFSTAEWAVAYPDIEASAEFTLARARAVVPASIRLSTMLVKEALPKAALRELRNRDYDLIVIGSRHHGARRFSAGRFLARRVDVPVLVVHVPTSGPRAASERSDRQPESSLVVLTRRRDPAVEPLRRHRSALDMLVWRPGAVSRDFAAERLLRSTLDRGLTQWPS